MELKEDKISFADIKQYLLLLVKDMDRMNKLEFKTLKGWLVYSLSLVILFCTPGVIILLITGLLSGGMSVSLLVSVSFIPFMFGLPLILLLTFVNNYRKPKQLRKPMLQALERYDWDEPIKQVGQARFECVRNNYVFRTEIYYRKNKYGREEPLICMIIPYFLPVGPEKEAEYVKDIDAYLEGKSFFVIQTDMAYLGVPVQLFPKLDLRKDIEQLLYVMQRFALHPCTFYSPANIIDKVPVTHEILALTVFGQYVINRKWTDWAGDMLQAGFINASMKSFASQDPLMVDPVELKNRMNVLIREFNLDLSDENILGNYIRFLLIEKEQGRRSVPEIIQCLDDLYLLSGIAPLYNFHLLYNAKVSLTKTGKQNFWIDYDLSTENVDSYILAYLYNLLENDPPIRL